MNGLELMSLTALVTTYTVVVVYGLPLVSQRLDSLFNETSRGKKINSQLLKLQKVR